MTVIITGVSVRTQGGRRGVSGTQLESEKIQALFLRCLTDGGQKTIVGQATPTHLQQEVITRPQSIEIDIEWQDGNGRCHWSLPLELLWLLKAEWEKTERWCGEIVRQNHRLDVRDGQVHCLRFAPKLSRFTIPEKVLITICRLLPPSPSATEE